MTKFSNMSKTSRKNIITLLGTFIFFSIVFLFKISGLTTNLINGMLVSVCAYMIMAVSLNLTVGILGELSLGHAGFMSIGAFTSVTVTQLLQRNIKSLTVCILIGILCGTIAAMLAGVLIGIPVLRLNGDYLAIVTLAFGEIIKSIVNNLFLGYDENGVIFNFVKKGNKFGGEGVKEIIKGPQGITGISKYTRISPNFGYILGCILVLLTLVIAFNLIQSRTGRAAMAIRDNRIAAESVGIHVTKYKLLVFSISAALAGMAGGLYAPNFASISGPKFDYNTSILILVFVVLGGLGNIRGSLIATTVITMLPEFLRGIDQYRMLFYAITLILVMLFTNNPVLKGAMKSAFDIVAKPAKKSVDSVKSKRASKGGNK